MKSSNKEFVTVDFEDDINEEKNISIANNNSNCNEEKTILIANNNSNCNEEKTILIANNNSNCNEEKTILIANVNQDNSDKNLDDYKNESYQNGGEVDNEVRTASSCCTKFMDCIQMCLHFVTYILCLKFLCSNNRRDGSRKELDFNEYFRSQYNKSVRDYITCLHEDTKTFLINYNVNYDEHISYLDKKLYQMVNCVNGMSEKLKILQVKIKQLPSSVTSYGDIHNNKIPIQQNINTVLELNRSILRKSKRFDRLYQVIEAYCQQKFLSVPQTIITFKEQLDTLNSNIFDKSEELKQSIKYKYRYYSCFTKVQRFVGQSTPIGCDQWVIRFLILYFITEIITHGIQYPHIHASAIYEVNGYFYMSCLQLIINFLLFSYACIKLNAIFTSDVVFTCVPFVAMLICDLIACIAPLKYDDQMHAYVVDNDSHTNGNRWLAVLGSHLFGYGFLIIVYSRNQVKNPPDFSLLIRYIAIFAHLFYIGYNITYLCLSLGSRTTLEQLKAICETVVSTQLLHILVHYGHEPEGRDVDEDQSLELSEEIYYSESCWDIFSFVLTSFCDIFYGFRDYACPDLCSQPNMDMFVTIFLPIFFISEFTTLILRNIVAWNDNHPETESQKNDTLYAYSLFTQAGINLFLAIYGVAYFISYRHSRNTERSMDDVGHKIDTNSDKYDVAFVAVPFFAMLILDWIIQHDEDNDGVSVSQILSDMGYIFLYVCYYHIRRVLRKTQLQNTTKAHFRKKRLKKLRWILVICHFTFLSLILVPSSVKAIRLQQLKSGYRSLRLLRDFMEELLLFELIHVMFLTNHKKKKRRISMDNIQYQQLQQQPLLSQQSLSANNEANSALSLSSDDDYDYIAPLPNDYT